VDCETNIKTLDLVITDYMMPEMDGISFLAHVKRRFPLVPRILLTGYADKENAIKAINNVGLYQYIEKPWNNDDLRLIIRNGLEKTTLLKQLEEKVREVERVHKELTDVHKDILRVFV
jgi:response regulator RpfG family c-di-GMP phosphodiesterase